MKKKLLLCARDPGGSNTVIPLVAPLRDRGYEVLLAGKDTALKKYMRAGLDGIDIMDFLPAAFTETDIADFLRRESPHAVITGTSADDYTEKFLWKAAEEQRIPSFAILDNWVNYGLRFSPYSIAELERYIRDKSHPYLPAKILVMDEIAKQGLLDDGIPKERIVITGQPYFADIFDCAACFRPGRLKQKRSELGAERAYLITFASEPLSKAYGTSPADTHYLGYTERTILTNLIQALERICRTSAREVCLVLKLHPKDVAGDFADVLAASQSRSVKIVIDQTSDPRELMLASDLVCGMGSMFLLESVLLGKPTVSIQIGLCRETKFILDEIGVLPSILTEKDLLAELDGVINKGKKRKLSFSIIRNPVHNVIKTVEAFI